MTIRNKLTLLFTGLVAFILLSLNLYIYLLSQRYTRQEFYDRLEQRAQLAWQLFLEKEAVDARTAASIRKRFQQALPEEVIRIYDAHGNELAEHEHGAFEFGPDILSQLMRDPVLQHKDGKRQFAGLQLTSSGNRYLVVASAIDIYGTSKLNNLRQVLFLAFIAGILAVYLTGRYLSFKSLQPVSRMVKQVHRITASNLHLRIREGNNKDEIGALARTFNTMLGRLQASFDSQRTFVRNASHQLRTPLAVIIGEIEVTLNRERDAAEYRKTLELALAQANQLTALVNDLLSLATSDEAAQAMTEEVRIDELLWDLQTEMIRAYPNAKLQLNLDSLPENPEQITVRGNRSFLKQALGNIIGNALKYSDGQPASIDLQAEEQQVSVTVKDEGIGIREEDQPQLFQPFFRGSNAQAKEGHGIGLALAKNLIQMHSGSIRVLSALNKGTTVQVLLPNLQA